MLQGNGMGSFSARIAFAAGVTANSLDVGDFNGDGKPDIVVSGRDTSEISVLLGDGFGGFSAPTVIPVGGPGGSLVLPAVKAVDLDGDAILDLAVTNLAASTVSILIGNPAGGGGTGFVGPPGDFSTLVDNGDGTFTRTLKNGTRIEFDATGLQTAVIDRNGNTTNYAYDGQGRLTTITDPMGLVTTLAYSGDRLASVTDPALRVTSFVHDGDGNLTSITDPDLSVRQFTYDARHRLKTNISKRGFATSYDYDFAGRHIQTNMPDTSTRKYTASQVVGVIDTTGGAGAEGNPAPYTRPAEVLATFTDGNNNTTTFTLNSFGGDTEFTDALGRVTTTGRDLNSNATQVTNPNGRVDQFTYDARGNVLTRTEAVGDPLERVRTFAYEPNFNRVTSITDPAGKVTTFAYDANGNLLTRTDPLSGTRTFTYNAQGLVLTVTDENTNITTITYDANGNQATITDAENNVTSFVRDAAGNITAVTEGVGTPEVRTSNFTYDALNRQITLVGGNGELVSFVRDASGNITSFAFPTGQVVSRGYDELERIVQIDNPATGTTLTSYGGNGNIVQVVDGLNRSTTFEYDAADRLTKTIDALLGETVRTYDVMDNQLMVTDPRNQTTSFEYDLLNRMTKQTNPLGQFATFTYDSRDNRITVTDPKGQITTNGYDELSRLPQVTRPDNLITITYDAVANALTVVDDDSSLSFTYDGLNRRLTASTVLGGIQPVVTLTNTYDAVGNRTRVDDSQTGVTQFVYDADGQITQLTTPASAAIDLSYDPAGRITGLTFPNTVTSISQYDIEGRLVDVTHSAGATPFQSFAYAHDAVGNILSITEAVRTRNFAYDDLERLTAGGTAAAPESYSYDGIGNRTASHLSASHVTNSANRLTEDDSFCYAFDANGNLETRTAKVAGACTGDITSYTWDARDRLVRIDFPDLTTASYRYDALGRRIEKDVDGVITRYVYDGLNIVMEFDGANTLLARYSHGLGSDQPMAMERGGQSFFYHADHQGSVTQITDAAGFVVNSYEYDSYGNIESAVEGVPNPFTYTGREFDAESGLYYYRFRYYDSQTGRFLKEDPIGFAAGDLNLYRYVFNNPVRFTDPLGLVVNQNCVDAWVGFAIAFPCPISAVLATAFCATFAGVESLLCGGAGFIVCVMVVQSAAEDACECDTNTCTGECQGIEECEEKTCPKDEGSS